MAHTNFHKDMTAQAQNGNSFSVTVHFKTWSRPLLFLHCGEVPKPLEIGAPIPKRIGSKRSSYRCLRVI